MYKVKKLKQIVDKFIEDVEEIGFIVYREEDKENLVIDIEEKK